MSYSVEPNHPLAEILAKTLFGIEVVPIKEQRKMVNRAINVAVEFHESFKNKATSEITQLIKNLDKTL